MKAKEVLKLLRISRQTLSSYVKSGQIKAALLPNGQYDYDEDSVLSKAGVTTVRKCVVYARVSTKKQKNDLQNQVDALVKFSNANGLKVDEVYKDVASGISYDRHAFLEMLNLVLDRKIKTVVVSDRDRLTRVSFDMWKELFGKFNCEIIVMNDKETSEIAEKELFRDIISMLHCFSMRMYSARRKKKVELVAEDMENEIS